MANFGNLNLKKTQGLHFESLNFDKKQESTSKDCSSNWTVLRKSELRKSKISKERTLCLSKLY